jgi:hypothetical protein
MKKAQFCWTCNSEIVLVLHGKRMWIPSLLPNERCGAGDRKSDRKPTFGSLPSPTFEKQHVDSECKDSSIRRLNDWFKFQTRPLALNMYMFGRLIQGLISKVSKSLVASSANYEPASCYLITAQL